MRRRPQDTYAVMLLAQLAQQVGSMNHKPPATLALIAAQVAAFFFGDPAWQSAFCLLPARILGRGEWVRLLASAFLHVDEVHLYYNM